MVVPRTMWTWRLRVRAACRVHFPPHSRLSLSHHPVPVPVRTPTSPCLTCDHTPPRCTKRAAHLGYSFLLGGCDDACLMLAIGMRSRQRAPETLATSSAREGVFARLGAEARRASRPPCCPPPRTRRRRRRRRPVTQAAAARCGPHSARHEGLALGGNSLPAVRVGLRRDRARGGAPSEPPRGAPPRRRSRGGRRRRPCAADTASSTAMVAPIGRRPARRRRRRCRVPRRRARRVVPPSGRNPSWRVVPRWVGLCLPPGVSRVILPGDAGGAHRLLRRPHRRIRLENVRRRRRARRGARAAAAAVAAATIAATTVAVSAAAGVGVAGVVAAATVGARVGTLPAW